MSNVQLGELLKGGEKRDAVHVAVYPVTALQEFQPGEKVGITGTFVVKIDKGNKAVGIIDPLLKESVKAYQDCYVWMFPNTVQNLRHDWDHPDLPKLVQIDEGEFNDLRERQEGGRCSGC